ncbi:hypothetical protein LLH00_17530, partial [bacterium]|nr:hypothetical protein [bacterium]
ATVVIDKGQVKVTWIFHRPGFLRQLALRPVVQVRRGLHSERLMRALESDRQSELEHRRQMLARLRQTQKEREKEMER